MTQKATFLPKIYEAFAKNNTRFIAENVTDNIQWTIVGDRSLSGKEVFIKALKEMESEYHLELTIRNIITHGDSAVVDGTMKSADEKPMLFAMCIYSADLKIQKLK